MKVEDTTYRFSVQDDGPGIDPAFHHKAFEMFQTLQPRDEVENTGIGLTIVRKIVQAEGGNVWLDSADGKGTKLVWEIPIPVEAAVS